MRQIKFRAKTTANGHWVYGSLIVYDDNTCAIRNRKSQPWVQPDTVGQFTGLLDRNGKEIYEGDILKSLCNNIVAVEFGYYEDIVRLKGMSFDDSFAAYGWIVRNLENGTRGFLDNSFLRGEIFGNIHDNPELKGNEQSKVRRMNRKKKQGLYQTNKVAKVGETIECPVCHTKFTKIQWAQAFCCGHCKDKFWNTRCKDRHRYKDSPDDGMTDHDWDEAFGVAEYND